MLPIMCLSSAKRAHAMRFAGKSDLLGEPVICVAIYFLVQRMGKLFSSLAAV